jgi:hypothetical protein
MPLIFLFFKIEPRRRNATRQRPRMQQGKTKDLSVKHKVSTLGFKTECDRCIKNDSLNPTRFRMHTRCTCAVAGF